jgi:large subunit ribosomal protein L10
MNREQKAATIETLVGEIQESQAIFAVDYRGISVAQVAELRAKLREADASFRVVKNSLTERAADQAGAETLKDYLAGPTALTFVRGDAALAAKAVADYARATQLLPFKGGMMDGATLDAEQIRSISRLPSREVLYGQLVGMVASPLTGLVRTLGALVGGLAVALGQVQQKKESGEIPAGESPAAPAAEDAPEAETPAEEASATEAEASTEEAASAEPESPVAEDDPPEELVRAQDTAVEPPPDTQAEPEQDQPAQDDDKQADASAEAEQDPADAKSTKED